MRLNKKSGLLLFNVLVVLFAITCTLVLYRGTAATDTTPANSEFDDVNFYNCVIDAYNQQNDANVEYTTSLSDDELSTIIKVDCSDYGLSDDEKIKSVKGLEKLTSLEQLVIMGHQLTSLDVSKNTKLTHLNVANNQLEELDLSNNTALIELDSTGNKFGGTLYVYKNGNVTVENLVKFPSNINTSELKWESSDSNIATVDENGIVKTLKSGNVLIKGVISNDDINYKVTSATVNVIEIISDKYNVNEDSNYIIVTDLDEETIKDNITVPENISLDVDLSNYKLLVKYNEEKLKEFAILSIDFGSMDESEKVITLTNDLTYEEFTNNIDAIGVTYKIYNNDTEVVSGNILDGMVVIVYYNNQEIDKFDIDVNSYSLKLDSSLSVDEDKKYINYLSTGTIVSEFLSKVSVSGNDTKKVIYTNNKYEKTRDDDDVVTSGDVLVVYMNDTIKDEYVLSVLGDANGDGNFNQIDLVQMRKHMAQWVNPTTNIVFEKTGVYYYSLDMDKNGTINQIDLVRMRKRIAGVI